MSARLMGQVFKLDLPSTDKFVLVAMADYASDDGTHCYPSVAALCRKTNLCERSVQYALRRLELAKILIAQGVSAGRSTTEYRIAVENSAQGILLGVQDVHPRVQLVHSNPAPHAPDPLRTVIEPKERTPRVPRGLSKELADRKNIEARDRREQSERDTWRELRIGMGPVPYERRTANA
jgi:hypothetical protein